jgi:hypothetical protein
LKGCKEMRAYTNAYTQICIFVNMNNVFNIEKVILSEAYCDGGYQ